MSPFEASVEDHHFDEAAFLRRITSPKAVHAALDQRIDDSQESLYFILRSLGLPSIGEPGKEVLRVEVEKVRQPTLWTALERLGMPHDGKRMIIEANGAMPKGMSDKVSLGRAMRRPKSASATVGKSHSVPALALQQLEGQASSMPSRPTPPVSADEQRLKSEILARPRRPSRSKASSSNGQHGGDINSALANTWFLNGSDIEIGYNGGFGGTVTAGPGSDFTGYGGLRRAQSERRLSKSDTEELLSRLAVPKFPNQPELDAAGFLRAFQDLQKTGHVNAIPPEVQRLHVEQLARPKPRPRPPMPYRPRPRVDAKVAAEQRSSTERLSKPKQASNAPTGPPAPAPAPAPAVAAARPKSALQRSEVSKQKETQGRRRPQSGAVRGRSTGSSLQADVYEEESGRHLLAAMRRNREAALAQNADPSVQAVRPILSA
eukprot:TRINITY_DN2571_c0_g2_i1.p1 TRINITY_DN2571_c0_g2~~TRINITY_DN2571_c0_g2_i1.p1  ORF type:complete len:433 (-),score=88.52 TRINITY_DN2571_c0_g2_i1:62-1360(-)